MPHLVTCPRCSHGVDTYVGAHERTHCEECGALIDVPEGAQVVDEGPPVDVVRERGRLARRDLESRPGALRRLATWSDGTPLGPASRFARWSAIAVVLTLFVLAVLPGVSELFERDTTRVDITGLVASEASPDARFATHADLRAAIEAASDGHGCDVVAMQDGFGFAYFEGNSFEVARLVSLLDGWRAEGN